MLGLAVSALLRYRNQRALVWSTLGAFLLVGFQAYLGAETVRLGNSGASVTARILGETKGPKIRGFTYKNKTNNRRRWGHRQRYATIEITGISK